MFISKSVKETKEIAAALAKKIQKGGVVCLFGELGSGKTVFVKGLAQGLGLKEISIKSPTYTYIREHNHFYHIDLYRLEKIDELLWHTIQEILENKRNIAVIEWADRLGRALPKKRITVHMKYLDENSRKIIIK